MPPIRPEVKRLSVALLGLTFAVGYFTHFPFPDIFSKLLATSLAALVLLSAYGWGTPLVRRLAGRTLAQDEHIILSTLLGLAVWSLLLFIGGIFGLWLRIPLVVCLTVGLSLAFYFRHAWEKRAEPSAAPSWPAVPCALIIVGGTLSLLIAYAPPTYYDTLVYHYALPQTYWAAGRWQGQPELIYSAFPQNMEMLWLLGMGLSGDTVANLIGWGISVLGIATVFLFGKRFISEAAGWWGASLLAIMPTYLLLSSGGYVDVGLAVFSFATLYILAVWADKRTSGLLILAGIFAGYALGIKYTGGLIVLLGTCFVVYLSHSERYRKTLLSIGLFALSSLVVFLPWALKNIHYVGNPVFPFLYKWSSQASPWTQQAAEGYFRGLTEYAPRSIWQIGKLVWEIAVGGLNFGGGMDILGDLGWGALFAFLPLLLLSHRWPKGVKITALFTLAFLIPWGLSRPVLRFLLPIAPCLALLAGFTLQEVLTHQPVWLRRSGQIFLALLLCSNLELFFEVTNTLGLYRVPLASESREDYLSRRLKYYRAARVLEKLPVGAKTYVLGDQSAYYYNTPVLIAPVFNINPLAIWVNHALDAKTLAELIRAHGFTHLLINQTELQRLNAAYGIFRLTERGQKVWDTFLAQRTQRLYRDNHCEVLTVS